MDIGEGFPFDRELLQFATSANVCLGYHAGDKDTTYATYRLCKELRKRIGAHPGYPDRPTMGRGPRQDSDEFSRGMAEQLEMVKSGLEFDYVKAHGAFYNESAVPLPAELRFDSSRTPTSESLQRLRNLNEAASDLVAFGGPFMGLEGTTHRVVADLAGTFLIREGFADRAYRPNGQLVPRSEPGAVLEDPERIKRQVLDLAPRVDSICLHGDTRNCLEFAEMIYRTLRDAGYEVAY